MQYLPQFKGPIEGYVVNTLKTNLWRIKATHEHEDAMQEAHLVFLRCAAKYPIIDTPQHFMSLFKTAWANKLNDLATKASKRKVEVSEWAHSREDEEDWARDHVGELENAGMLMVMIRQAPREVMMVLNLFLAAPHELLALATETWRNGGRRRDDGNELIGRLLGIDPATDPLGQVEEYFRRDH